MTRILSLDEKKEIGTETSYSIDKEHIVEEAGGQHLYSALHLVDRGLRVAIATAIGEDEAGDRVLAETRAFVERRGVATS